MAERFEFKNSYGEKLVGVKHESDGKTGDPCVIACHGFTGNKDKNWIKTACERIVTEVKITAVRFDFSGNGESEGEFAKASYIKEAKDLRSVIDELEYRGYKRFLLVGHSMGSAVCLLEASEDTRVVGIVDVSGTGDTRRFVTQRFEPGEWAIPDTLFKHTKRDGREFFVSKEFVDAGRRIDLPKIVSNLKIPAIFVHGDADESVPITEGQMLFTRYAGPKEFVTIHNAGHTFIEPGKEKEMLDAVVAWLRRHVVQ